MKAAGLLLAIGAAEPLLRQETEPRQLFISSLINSVASIAQNPELVAGLEAVAGTLVQGAVGIADQIQKGELPLPPGRTGSAIGNVAGRVGSLAGNSNASGMGSAASVGRPELDVSATTTTTAIKLSSDSASVNLGGLEIPVVEELKENLFSLDEEFLSDEIEAMLPLLFQRRLNEDEDEILSVFDNVPLAERTTPRPTVVTKASPAEKRAVKQAAKAERKAAKTKHERINDEDGYGVAPTAKELAALQEAQGDLAWAPLRPIDPSENEEVSGPITTITPATITTNLSTITTNLSTITTNLSSV